VVYTHADMLIKISNTQQTSIGEALVLDATPP